METEGDLYGRVVVAEWADVARQNDAAADALRRKRDSLGRSIASDLASGQPPHQLQTYQAMVRLVGEGDSSGLQLQPGGERDSALLSNFWESRLEWCWKNEMSAAILADWYMLEESMRTGLDAVHASIDGIGRHASHDGVLTWLREQCWILVEAAVAESDFVKAERAAELVLRTDHSLDTVHRLIEVLAPGGREVGEAFLTSLGRWLREPERTRARAVLEAALRVEE